jgi:translation initiation factor IF-2
MLELHAEAEGAAEAIVLEASVRKGVGSVATVLVQRGRLRTGDHFVTGGTYGKARASPSRHALATF